MHRRLTVRTVAIVATLLYVLALAPVLPARADTPGTTVSVSQWNNLAASQSINVSGAGFTPSFTDGFLNQCGVQPGLDFESCRDLGTTINTNASGSFGPVSVTVQSTFTPDDGSPDINCANTTCTIFASTNELNAHRRISFGVTRQPYDFDGNGSSDRSIFRPSTSQFFVNGASPEVTQYGIADDVPVPADYNGDGVVDKAVYRRSTGQWFIRNASPVPEVIPYGAACSSNCATAGDIPVPADYDGDGDADIAVYRPTTGQWFVRGSLVEVVQYGLGCGACASPTDIPVPGDYTGDGLADRAVFRTTTGQWFVQNGPEGVPYGTSTDRPAPADYDGDGDIDIAVYRPSTGQWFRRGVAPETVQYGLGGACCGDVPVPADFDGNADASSAADIAIYRRSTGQWFVMGGSPETVPYGNSADIPLAIPYAIRVFAGFTQ